MSQCNERSKQTASAIKHKRACARRHSGSSSGSAILGCINSNLQETAGLKQQRYRYYGQPCERRRDRKPVYKQHKGGWNCTGCPEAPHRNSGYSFFLPLQNFNSFENVYVQGVLLSINESKLFNSISNKLWNTHLIFIALLYMVS